MATDRLGNTIATGQVYGLAGKVRAISGDSVLIVLGLNGEHAIRVNAGDVVPVDASRRQLVTLRPGGTLIAGEWQVAVPAAATIIGVQLVCDTATTGSSSGVHEWTFELDNITAGSPLFSSTPGTDTPVSGVGGGEIGADAQYLLTANQNQAAAAGEVIRLTITKTGSPTEIPDGSIHLILSI